MKAYKNTEKSIRCMVDKFYFCYNTIEEYRKI
ncbi:Uncharacterised protein [uncultured Clostridium sp.]|nr:Uncharacterised protein [uncultured Clostridium sp.]